MDQLELRAEQRGQDLRNAHREDIRAGLRQAQENRLAVRQRKASKMELQK